VSTAVIVIGAGGHAKVCIELLQAMGERVAYCIGGQDGAESCCGVAVLRGDENLLSLRTAGYDRAFVAIGDNRLRRKLAVDASAMGFELVNAISPWAVLSPSARIGLGVAIMAGAVINAEAVIADLAVINTGATIDHDCHIGVAAHIAPQCALAGNVAVGEDSFLGIGCKVIPGVNIGARVTVGAGGVILSDIGNGKTVVGIPGRTIKTSQPEGL